LAIRKKDQFEETGNSKLNGWLFINLKFINADVSRRMSPLRQISLCFDEERTLAPQARQDEKFTLYQS